MTPPVFTLFPALPAELRLAIWQFSCHPRVVEVWYDADADCCCTTARPPAVLHASREARAEAMALYQRAFVTRSHPDRFIYFSPACDVLYLPRHGLMGYDETARDFTVHVRDTAPHVRALAIDHVRTDTIRPWEPYNKLMLIFSFPNVQETMLVVSSGTNDYRSPRRRSLDSVASASSDSPASAGSDAEVDADSGPEANAVPKIGDMELVDPKGDTAAVMRVINNVIESFSREIQDAGLPPNDCPAPDYPHMPALIPKAKAYHHQHAQHRRRHQKDRHRYALVRA